MEALMLLWKGVTIDQNLILLLFRMASVIQENGRRDVGGVATEVEGETGGLPSICTFVLLYFCTFVLLYFCTFALLYFCSIKDETGGLGSRERKSHEKGLVFRDLDVSNLVRWLLSDYIHHVDLRLTLPLRLRQLHHQSINQTSKGPVKTLIPRVRYKQPQKPYSGPTCIEVQRLLSGVTINCQVTMIVMNSGSQIVRIVVSVSNVTSLHSRTVFSIVKIVKNY